MDLNQGSGYYSRSYLLFPPLNNKGGTSALLFPLQFIVPPFPLLFRLNNILSSGLSKAIEKP